jgi:hypothetical protein
MQLRIGIKCNFKHLQNRFLIVERLGFSAVERHIYFDKSGKNGMV